MADPTGNASNVGKGDPPDPTNTNQNQAAASTTPTNTHRDRNGPIPPNIAQERHNHTVGRDALADNDINGMISNDIEDTIFKNMDGSSTATPKYAYRR